MDRLRRRNTRILTGVAMVLVALLAVPVPQRVASWFKTRRPDPVAIDLAPPAAGTTAPSAPSAPSASNPSNGASKDAFAASDVSLPSAVVDAADPRPQVSATAPRPPASAPLPSARMLSFVRVMPVAGVMVTVDDEAPVNISAGSTLSIDTRPHVLRFACVLQDACEADTRSVAAGASVDALAIELKIKPATLLVIGQTDGHYYIEDYASLDVKAGVPVRVPVSKAVNNYVTVIDRDSKLQHKVNLSAGKESRTSFAAP